MTSSEDYLRDLTSASGDWGAAIREFVGWNGSHAADVLAAAEGVSRRTAERWIAKATNKINPKTGRPSQASEPKPMQQVKIVTLAKQHRAAKKLRSATRVQAGTVKVAYESSGQGSRAIGSLSVDGVMGEYLEAAADYLEEGDYAAASEALDTGVLDAYGVPEGTLEIENYENGFEIE